MSAAAGVILAAGKGTRMKSRLPKVIHEVCGVPMVELVARALAGAGIQNPIYVIGSGAELVRERLGPDQRYAIQAEQNGTGHAMKMAMPELAGFQGLVVVTPGDTPLLDAESVALLLTKARETGAKAVVGTFLVDDPTGYGRMVRDDQDRPIGIVEHKDCSPGQLRINEVNSSIYCFDADLLREGLELLRNDNAQGEYYLTDVISWLASGGHRVETVCYPDARVFMGVNDRWQLTEAAQILRTRILEMHARGGVTIEDPGTTFIGLDVAIGEDTWIGPGTRITGRTKIGEQCRIGPNSIVNDSVVGHECVVLCSCVDRAEMQEASRCGPFAHLRPRTVLGPRVKIGNFVEVKNAQLGAQAAVSHLSYIGDATVGERTNIGAGTITCNYNGFGKYPTTIGDDTFVGSNSTLIAPVTIGSRSMVAAGSTINRDVPEDALALGRARQEVKEGWVKQWRSQKSETEGS